MDGKRTVGQGSYSFEVNKHKPDPKREGKITFDDCIHIWFPSRGHAWAAFEMLQKQLQVDTKKEDLHLTFCGELNFEKE